MENRNVSGIYLITISSSEGRNYYYVGQTSNCRIRKSDHFATLKRNVHKNKKMQSCYNKYQNFSYEILEKVPIENLDEVEQWWIDQMHGHKYCLNLARDAAVAGRGHVHSEESRRKMSKSHKGKVLSEEHRAKLKASAGGWNHTPESLKKISEASKERWRTGKCKGRPLSPEHKEKLREINKGKKMPPEHKAFLVALSTGRKHTEEAKKKISEAGKGRLMSEETKKKIGDKNRGKKASLETREKQSKVRKGRVLTKEWKENISKGLIKRKESNEKNER